MNQFVDLDRPESSSQIERFESSRQLSESLSDFRIVFGSLMLPLGLLKTAQDHPILVELKNGETYNGHLINCDTWMNVHLREVICTSKDGDRFWRIAETYVRGNTIKYIRVPDEVIDKVQDDVYVKPQETVEPAQRPMNVRGKGRGGGRGSLPKKPGGGPGRVPQGRGRY